MMELTELLREIKDIADEATSLDMSLDLDRRVGTRDEIEEPYLGDKLLELIDRLLEGLCDGAKERA